MPDFAWSGEVRRVEDMVLRLASRVTGVAGETWDELPVFTGGPLIYTMPQAYAQTSIDAYLGAVPLWPPTDFTAAGLTFTIDAAWGPAIAAGHTLRIRRARRTT